MTGIPSSKYLIGVRKNIFWVVTEKFTCQRRLVDENMELEDIHIEFIDI